MKHKESFLRKKGVIVLFAVIATFLWGSAFPAVKSSYELFQVAGDDTTAKLLLAGCRFALAGILVRLFSIIFYKKPRPLKKNEFLPVLGLGLIQTTMQYVFFYIGLAHTTGAKGSIMNSIGTFGAVLAAPLIYKNERFNIQKVVGCIMGVTGVILVNLQGGLEGGFRWNGEGFLLLSAIFSVGAFFISKEVTQKIEVMKATGYQLLLGGVILIIMGLGMGGNLTINQPASLLLLLYMAALSSVAFTLWTALLSKNPVGEISVYNLLVPVFGTMLSGVFLGENVLTMINLVSLILVSVGIGVVNRGST